MSRNESTPVETRVKQNQKQPSNKNSIAAQRQRLLKALKCRAVSTIRARRDLDIMMPGTRIFELRHHEGHDIETVWITEETEAGEPHRVAMYILNPGRGVR